MTAHQSSLCPHCKEPFTYGYGPGRKPIYCSDNCRKYAAAHRKYAQETGTPIRIIKDTEHTQPQPEPKTVRIYQRPRKKDLRAYLRENPQDVLPDMLHELGYCFTSEKISTEERARLAQAFGTALLRMHTAETQEPASKTRQPIVSGLSEADYAVYAEKIGAYEQLCQQVKDQQKSVEDREKYLNAYIQRRAQTLSSTQEQESVVELRGRIRDLEKAAERSAEFYASQSAQRERRYQEVVQQRLHVVHASRQRIEELEAEMGQWRERAQQWEQVAKMVQARAEEAAAQGQVRQVSGGAGSSFFEKK